jgi:ADP-heptose:LPS heptosyltransferase
MELNLEKERRILFINLLGIGNTVTYLSMLRAIYRKYPLIYDDSVSGFVRVLAGTIFCYNFVFVPYLGGKVLSILAFLTFAKRRFTWVDKENFRALWSFLFNEHIEVDTKELDARKHIRPFAGSGLIMDQSPQVDKDAIEGSLIFSAKHKLSKIISIHPGGDDDLRKWPRERYIELIKRLLAVYPQYKVILLAGPKELRQK